MSSESSLHSWIPEPFFVEAKECGRVLQIADPGCDAQGYDGRICVYEIEPAHNRHHSRDPKGVDNDLAKLSATLPGSREFLRFPEIIEGLKLDIRLDSHAWWRRPYERFVDWMVSSKVVDTDFRLFQAHNPAAASA